MKELQELIRRWTLEVAELQMLKWFCINLQNFTEAQKYREAEKQLQKRIAEVELLLKTDTEASNQ